MKKIKLCLLSLLITFVGIINVNAVNQTTGAMDKSTTRFKFNGTSIVDVNEAGDNSIFYKYAGDNSYVCISGIEVPIVDEESCTIDSSLVDSTKQMGAAYIIEKMTGTTGGIANMFSLKEKYYWLEIAILKYLGKTDGITLTDDVINAQIKLISGSTYDELKAQADAYANKYSKKLDINLELENGTNEIVFTEKNGLYLSQKIYLKDVNGNVDKIVPSMDNPNAEIIEGSDAKGKFYQIKINQDKVQGKKITVTLTINASNEYYIASFYDCSTGQDLMATVTEKQTKSDSAEITAELKSTKLTIYKKNANGNYLSNVKLKVESKDNNFSKEFITKAEPLVITDLKYGTYTITEISAPKGYSILKDSKTITLSEQKLSEEITLTNYLNKLEIKKVDAIDGTLLKGATLQIKDKDGKVIKEWISTTASYEIEGLETGVYYLVEEKAPKGYIKKSTPIKIEIKEDGQILINDKVSSNGVVKVKNDLTEVSISKINAANSKELPGATLRVLDKDKKEISCKILIDNKYKTLDTCSWVSGEKPVTVVGLNSGKYFLEETIAPKGFIKNTEMIEFEIKDDGVSADVVMKNDLEVEVPNTLSSRSALLIVIAMFDIALGIGILTYVKNRKIEE